MRNTLRAILSAAAAGAAALHGAALANGSIDTTNAAIAAGAAPQQGSVVVDPCAAAATAPSLPSLPALGTLGPMQGAVPAFPGGGPGGPDVVLAEGVSLPGGTYDCSSYTIASGISVVYEGPVTIRTTGDVVLLGSIFTQGEGHGVTFECAGDFRFSGPSGAGITTSGADSDIAIDVAGAIVTPTAEDTAPSFMRASHGDVELIARAAAPGFAVDLRLTTLDGKQVDVISATGIRADQSYLHGIDGVRLEAFAGDLSFARGTASSTGGPVGIAASGGVTLSAASIEAGKGDAVVTAHGGDVKGSDDGHVYVRAYEGSDGNLRLRAAGSVVFESGHGARVLDGAGTLELTAFGGDVALRPGQSAASGGSTFHQGTGTTVVTASGSVTSDGAFGADVGDVTVRALGGNVVLLAGAEVSTSGAVEVAASGVVRAGDSLAGATLRGGSLRASGTQIRLHGSEALAESGALTLIAGGTIASFGTIEGATSVSLASIGGAVTLNGATVTSKSNHGARSGDVAILAYGGAVGAISAQNAAVRSGDNATASGDVSLRVHTPFAPTVTSYLLPSSLTVKLGAARGAGLRAAGTLGFPADWTAPAPGATTPFELTLGSYVAAGELRTLANGALDAAIGTGSLRVTPPRAGSSAGTFALRIDGDLTGQAPADGTLALRLLLGAVDARGSVALTGGKFKLGRGEVLDPNLFALKVAAVVRGDGRDTLTATLGFAPADEAPATMPALTIGFGGFAATIPSDEFVSAGPGKFAAKKPASAPGLASVAVDFVRGTVLVKSKRGLDLGAFAPGASVLVPITLGLGPADVRTLEVELARKGDKLSW